MNKVICDICGTSYPGTAKKCPICGSSREYALENAEDASLDFDFLNDDAQVESASPKKSREIFDFDEVNQVKSSPRVMEEDDFDDEEEEYEEESRTNVGLVIVLVILIVLLLLAAGFFFVRYLLPNITDSPVETEPVVTTAPALTDPVETTQPTIPCTNLSIDGGKMELGKDGKKLLNIRIYPEDTTDELTMVSGDESIVTVSEDGTVTAVGEGQTVITITCGSQQINCNVTVDFSVGEETVPDEDVPAMQVDTTEPTAATDATDAAGETQATESTESTETTEETKSGEQTLKLKKTDITISSNYTSVQLEMDCDVKPEDMTWFTMDSTIAIVHGGLVTSTGSGLTRIYGEYGGQQVMCIVRCIF